MLCSDDDEETLAGTQRLGKRFTTSKKPVTSEVVKGVLLSTADSILSTLSEIILENAQHDKGNKDKHLQKWYPDWITQKISVQHNVKYWYVFV